MADTETANTPAAESTDSSPSVVEQSAAGVSGDQNQSAGEFDSDVSIPSIEADPWADLGKETTEETVTDDDAKTADTKVEPAEAVKTEDKPAEEKAADEEEKSIEDRVLEEAFGEKKPDDEPKQEESKEPTDKELDEADPQEMIKAQKNAKSEAWAERNFKRAEVIREFAYSDKPIAEIAGKFKELNESRYAELSQTAAHELVDANPEATFQRAFSVAMYQRFPFWDPKTAPIPTLESVIQGITNPSANDNGKGEHPDVAYPIGFAEKAKDLDAALGFDWRDPANDGEFYDGRELAMAKVLREAEVEMKALAEKQKPVEKQDEKPPEPKAQESQSKYTPEQQENIRVELDKSVNEYRSTVEAKILPWIAKNTGLEVSPEDTPEIKAFKENLMLHYRGTDYQRANNQPSDFEAFATMESSVAGQLEEVYTRVVDMKLQATVAAQEGRSADAAKYQAEAESERVTIINLLGVANNEFKAKRIAPNLKLIGTLSTSLSHKSQEASRRVEVTSSGGEPAPSPAPLKQYDTADDIWGSMVDEAREDDRLRASA